MCVTIFTKGVVSELTNNNINNNNDVGITARRIVKQLDLIDHEYNDIYSKPPPFPNNHNLFEDRPLGQLGFAKILPYPSLCQYQNTTIQNMYQYGQTSAASPSATSEKYLDYIDNPIFIIIRASEKRNIDIAQSCNKWVFSPQTEKKVLHLWNQGKRLVYLVFYVKEIQMFMGIAEYKCLNLGKYFSKPTASISWKFTTPLHKNKTKHLLNPYNEGKPIFDSHDGVVIRQDIGEELLRIYSEAEGFQ